MPDAARRGDRRSCGAAGGGLTHTNRPPENPVRFSAADVNDGRVLSGNCCRSLSAATCSTGRARSASSGLFRRNARPNRASRVTPGTGISSYVLHDNTRAGFENATGEVCVLQRSATWPLESLAFPRILVVTNVE
jgi:hypothetical protein